MVHSIAEDRFEDMTGTPSRRAGAPWSWRAARGAPEGRAFFDLLLADLREHPALRHPFLRRFAAGPLRREQIQAYALQHYMYSKLFTRFLAAALAGTPDEAVRAVIILNMYDEIGGNARPGEALSKEGSVSLLERTHPALFRRFLSALGIGRESAARAEALPETARFIQTYESLCRSSHWLTALGALGPGTECLVPQLYSYIHKGIEDSREVEPDDYVFWTVHIGCDDVHGDNLLESMIPYTGDPEHRRLIAEGARAALDARARWFDGLERAIFGATRHEAARPARSLPPRREGCSVPPTERAR